MFGSIVTVAGGAVELRVSGLMVLFISTHDKNHNKTAFPVAGLVPVEVPLAGLALTAVCCEPGSTDPSEKPEPGSHKEGHHGWLRQELVQNLPLGIKKGKVGGWSGTQLSSHQA